MTLTKLIQFLICHSCGTSIDRDLIFRSCSNCFACMGCEIYTCPECGTEIVVKSKKEPA